MLSFRLAHLSDPHLPSFGAPGGFRDLVSKRTLSRLAWRRKRAKHEPAVLAALVADIKAWAPDHVAVTGDLTNFSTPEEFARAGAWLSQLGPTTNVTLSPGNHDALVAQGHAERFETLGAWFGDSGDVTFPQVRRRGPVALINLCSATAMPPFLATGRLGPEQLNRLSQVLADLAGADVFRVVLLHHPVAEGIVSRRKALTDAAALREVLQRHGADLVLHGHAHEAVLSAADGPDGPIPMLGASAASATAASVHMAARWHAVTFEPQTGRMGVVARGLDEATGTIRELGRYALSAGRAFGSQTESAEPDREALDQKS